MPELTESVWQELAGLPKEDLTVYLDVSFHDVLKVVFFNKKTHLPVASLRIHEHKQREFLASLLFITPGTARPRTVFFNYVGKKSGDGMTALLPRYAFVESLNDEQSLDDNGSPRKSDRRTWPTTTAFSGPHVLVKIGDYEYRDPRVTEVVQQAIAEGNWPYYSTVEDQALIFSAAKSGPYCADAFEAKVPTQLTTSESDIDTAITNLKKLLGKQRRRTSA